MESLSTYGSALWRPFRLNEFTLEKKIKMGTQKYVQLTNAQGCFYTSTFKVDCPSKGYKAVLQRDFSRNEIQIHEPVLFH